MISRRDLDGLIEDYERAMRHARETDVALTDAATALVRAGAGRSFTRESVSLIARGDGLREEIARMVARLRDMPCDD